MHVLIIDGRRMSPFNSLDAALTVMLAYMSSNHSVVLESQA